MNFSYQYFPFLRKMSNKLGNLSKKLQLCAFTSVKEDSKNDISNVPSDDIIEKELEIKLDITKKSRRINRPVQFADQHGEIIFTYTGAELVTVLLFLRQDE